MWVRQLHKPPMTGICKRTRTSHTFIVMIGGWCVYGIVLPTWNWNLCGIDRTG